MSSYVPPHKRVSENAQSQPREQSEAPRGRFDDLDRPPRDGFRDGPRGYRDGPRDGYGYRDGPRDGYGYRDGPRDGYGYRDGPRGFRDGPRGFRDGPRDGPRDIPPRDDAPRGSLSPSRDGQRDTPPRDVPPRDDDYDRFRDGPRDGYREGFRDGPRDGYRDGFRDGPRDYGRGRDSFFNRDREGYRPRFDRGGRFGRNDRSEEELFKNQITTGINFDKYEDIPVDVKGENVPPPIETFLDSGLHPALMKNIERAGYTKPTPVQKHSISIATTNRDLMACAQTGSGKTGGFLFPIIHNLLTSGAAEERRGYRGDRTVYPQALILSPTRELTTQIHDEARKFTYQTDLRAVVVYGGAPIGEQIRSLNQGCNILVATPGRLVDLLERGCVSLEKVKILVLDEADNMLDMGFEPQIRQIVEKENMPPKSERQTMMYSATFPKEIQALASSFLNDYIFLTVGRVGSTTDLITQVVLYVEDRDKIDALLSAIENSKDGLTLVFTKTKRDCDAVEYELNRIGMRCESIHGDRSQQDRERSLKNFKTGRANVLIATDVASRGLNIPNVTHVINFDMPENIDSYIHRIGRTGRAGNEGRATSFYNSANNMVISDLIDILEETKQTIPDWMKREKALYERNKSLKKKSKLPTKNGYGARPKPLSRWSGGASYGEFGGDGFGRGGWGSSGF